MFWYPIQSDPDERAHTYSSHGASSSFFRKGLPISERVVQGLAGLSERRKSLDGLRTLLGETALDTRAYSPCTHSPQKVSTTKLSARYRPNGSSYSSRACEAPIQASAASLH